MVELKAILKCDEEKRFGENVGRVKAKWNGRIKGWGREKEE